MGKKPRTAITPTREDNFPEWYLAVVKAAEMAEGSPVRGCMTIRPYGYTLWENMQRKMDARIKQTGTDNAYFPLLIPLKFMEKEAEHIDGFAKECAVVTHHRLEADADGNLKPGGELQEPYIIRPTSETIIGEAFSNWIQSYRDLPYKINQWANVMRWEMRPRTFLRTSEFLWQEGHTVHASAEEANAFSREILEMYAEFAEHELALPVIKGEKTADERFPGAKHTYTIEAMMQDGKALQAGTSHDLGQSFAKAANIDFLDQSGQHQLAHTTSWGTSTRLIGGMIMRHGDDDGMVMPPRVAPYQAVIVPIIHNEEDRAAILEFAKTIQQRLQSLEYAGRSIRIHIDARDDDTPTKLWHWVKKGVPLRLDIGKREMDENSISVALRDLGKAGKISLSPDELHNRITTLLDELQHRIFNTAKTHTDSNIIAVDSIDAALTYYGDGGKGFVQMDKALFDSAEFDKLSEAHAISSRCMPYSDPQTVICGKSY